MDAPSGAGRAQAPPAPSRGIRSVADFADADTVPDGNGHDGGVERPGAAVPPVVAVVVTHDAGPWLEETIGALAGQDYPDLTVLVVDAASAVDPTPRIAAVLPSAYVRRLAANPGFSAAANEVLGGVEGASHYVFLHDDAAPHPDAIRLLVEEAFRSNAGVVSPKFVEWDDERRLLGVGAAADKAGVVRPYGRHELDQEQHDAVRDVFVAPGGCTLVRADLFAALGGFDPGVALFGEDLDLSWRAQILGARVVVAPEARVRHREATSRGERPLALGSTSGGLTERVARLQLRHRLRSVLKNYGTLHLWRVMPQLLVLMAGEAGVALVTGRHRLAGAVADAWRWNLGHSGELWRSRREVRRRRVLKDSEVRRLQTRGSVRLADALRGGVAAEERTFGVAAAGRHLAGAVASGGGRVTVAVWAGLAVVVLFGSRALLDGPIPAVGRFAPFPDSPLTFLRVFMSGWRTSGLGSEGPAPPAFAFLGLAGLVTAGAMGLLQKLVVLGMIPLGIAGAHRMTAPLGSWRARLAGAVLYAAVPLPYDALARGRWSGLMAYAAAPWIMARLARATGLAPLGAPPDEASTPPAGRRLEGAGQAVAPDTVDALSGAEAATSDAIAAGEFRVAVAALIGRPAGRADPARAPAPAPGLVVQVAAAALLLAVVGAFVPAVVVTAVVIGAGVVIGSLLTGDGRAGSRALVVAAGASVGAAALLAPWSFGIGSSVARWAAFAGMGAPVSEAPGLGALLRFDTGATGGTNLGWALPVAATLPLLLGRSWRFAWAVRAWTVAMVALGLAWAAGRGWSGLPPPALDVMLAPAAAALVLAAALGLSANQLDLRGYRFGWRQLASLVAGGAAVLSTLPVLAAATDGHWRMPRRDLAGLLSWLPEGEADGPFRILWAGRPEALPLDGWRLDDGLAYASSRGATPDATDLWAAGDEGATRLLGDALEIARRKETSRLGHLLGPLGVRYVVMPLRAAPTAAQAPEWLPPDDVVAALRAQVDLRQLETDDDAVIVYENTAWAPVRSVLPPAASVASHSSGPAAASVVELAGAAPALAVETGASSYTGDVVAGTEIYLAEAYSPRWRLDTGDERVVPRLAFGWANAFEPAASGEATLAYRTSPLRLVTVAVEVALWLAAIRFVVRSRRRPAPSPPA